MGLLKSPIAAAWISFCNVRKQSVQLCLFNYPDLKYKYLDLGISSWNKEVGRDVKSMLKNLAVDSQEQWSTLDLSFGVYGLKDYDIIN